VLPEALIARMRAALDAARGANASEAGEAVDPGGTSEPGTPAPGP